MRADHVGTVGPIHRMRSGDGVEWEIGSATTREWESVLAASPEPHLTQTPEWMHLVVTATHGQDATRIYRCSDGRRMVLPLIERGGPGTRLRRYASLGHGWGRGGIVADTPLTSDAADVVLRDLTNLGAASIRVRTQPDEDEAWAGAPRYGFTPVPRITHLVDLSPGFDHIWHHVLSGATRTKVRKAIRVGVQVEQTVDAAHVSSFYALYEAWLRERARRRRLPPALLVPIGRRREPKCKFDAAARLLSDHLRIWVASLEGVPIASCLQLIHGTHSTYWRGYSLRETGGRCRATYLLQTRMIEEACSLGCTIHDMGDSGGVATLMQFKEVFGAVATPYHEWCCECTPLTKLRAALGRDGEQRQRGVRNDA